jgi:hypothetical protein
MHLIDFFWAWGAFENFNYSLSWMNQTHSLPKNFENTHEPLYLLNS